MVSVFVVYRCENTSSRLVELQAELNDFVANDESDLLVFPSSLTAHDRFLVHEVECHIIIAPDKELLSTEKLIFFQFLIVNICCGYSLEVPHRGTSNEYPQHMFIIHLFIITRFLINMRVQGQHPHQWASFQVAGLLHAWQISHGTSRCVCHVYS